MYRVIGKQTEIPHIIYYHLLTTNILNNNNPTTTLPTEQQQQFVMQQLSASNEPKLKSKSKRKASKDQVNNATKTYSTFTTHLPIQASKPSFHFPV